MGCRSHEYHWGQWVWWQTVCGCMHSGRNVANNRLFGDIGNGCPLVGRMLSFFIHTWSLRMLVFIHVPIKLHMFHNVHAVMRSSPNRHIRSWQVCSIPLYSVAPWCCHESLIGLVLYACTPEIAVFIIFSGILAALGSMRPFRMHRARLG